MAMTFTMTAAVRQQIFQDLTSSFPDFGQEHAADYGEWSKAVLRNLRHTLFDSPRFQDGKIFKSKDRPHTTGTVFTPWLQCYEAFVGGLHDHCVITTADKLSNNYVVVCKKHYIQQVLADLGSGQFYAEKLATAQHTAMEGIVDSLLQQVTAVAVCMYEGSTPVK
jgi:hypothetical protein